MTTIPDTLLIKRRLSGVVGPPPSLLNGELAFNEVNEVLYYGAGVASDGLSAEAIIPIAGPGAYLGLTDSPTLVGDFTFTGSITVPDPVSSMQAATKNYVDSVAQGLSFKAPVIAVATSNILYSGLFILDGILLQPGQRVLLVGQSDATQNGIYDVQSSTWTRSDDASTSLDVQPGMYVYVEAGSTYGQTGWVLTTIGTIQLDITDLTFVQFSGAGSIHTGTGLSQTGNIISISPTYLGQSSINTLGTVTTGTWHGTPIGLSYGGTGANLTSVPSNSLLKVSGTSLVPAVAGTDYIATITEITLAQGGAGTNLTLIPDNSILKKLGAELVPAIADVDYKSLTGMTYLAQGGAGVDLTTFTHGSLLKLGTASMLPAVANTDYLTPSVLSVSPIASTAVLRSTDSSIQLATHTPASSSDIGTAGTVCWDGSYIYVCIANSTWKRAALTSW